MVEKYGDYQRGPNQPNCIYRMIKKNLQKNHQPILSVKISTQSYYLISEEWTVKLNSITADGKHLNTAVTVDIKYSHLGQCRHTSRPENRCLLQGWRNYLKCVRIPDKSALIIWIFHWFVIRIMTVVTVGSKHGLKRIQIAIPDRLILTRAILSTISTKTFVFGQVCAKINML